MVLIVCGADLKDTDLEIPLKALPSYSTAVANPRTYYRMSHAHLDSIY